MGQGLVVVVDFGITVFVESLYVNPLSFISSHIYILVHGAMRCLALLCVDLDDKMVPTLITAVFPSLLTIVSSPQVIFCIFSVNLLIILFYVFPFSLIYVNIILSVSITFFLFYFL